MSEMGVEELEIQEGGNKCSERTRWPQSWSHRMILGTDQT